MDNFQSIFQQVLETGVASKASDWHFKEGRPVAIRIAGELIDTDLSPDAEFLMNILKGIATQEQMRKYAETGDVDLSMVVKSVGRFRVNFHRQRGSHAMTLRHVKRDIMSFEQLGLPPILEKIAQTQRGLIIVCGTTGSGKSTTLASILEYINLNFSRHVITIEDPIEYEFFDKKSYFEQREVGLDTSNFYNALVHSLRQDPDIIMVGEMRDRESFEAALQAADTGHLVLTTLHATNSSQAINRILDLYKHEEQRPVREALALNMRAVIAQRLLPKAFGGGVTPAVEVMMNSPTVKKLLERDKLEKLALAIETGKDDGMQSFNQALLKLINNGEITEEEGLEAASNPESLKMNLQGIFLGTDNQILGD